MRIVLFIVLFLIGLGGVLGYRYYQVNTQAPSSTIQVVKQTPQPTFSIENPPSESLKANVTKYSGQIKWGSRIATEPAELNQPLEKIQQGEDLATEKDGLITFSFPQSVDVAVSHDSALSVIQTLPYNIVFNQTKGIVEFSNVQAPVSVRTLHMIVNIHSGDAVITVDEKGFTTDVDVKSGSASVGYNNTQNVTRRFDVSAGDTFRFNDTTRRGTIY